MPQACADDHLQALIARVAAGDVPLDEHRREAWAQLLVECLSQRPIDEALFLAAAAPDWQNPLKGLDYKMEGGLLVFSAWYHLRRGYCCGNGCRHCPYPPELKAG
ncbi:MAG: DUF5522 domain-containing protein [Gammaproteobacteria bacterium]